MRRILIDASTGKRPDEMPQETFELVDTIAKDLLEERARFVRDLFMWKGGPLCTSVLSSCYTFLFRAVLVTISLLRILVKRFPLSKKSAKASKRRGKHRGGWKGKASSDDGSFFRGALRALHKACSEAVGDIAKHVRSEMGAQSKDAFAFDEKTSCVPLEALSSSLKFAEAKAGNRIVDDISVRLRSGQRKTAQSLLRTLSKATVELKTKIL